MLKKQLFLGATLSAVGMCVAPALHAQARNELSAQDAKYPCPVPAGAAAMLARAAELYPAKHDKNQLGCSADLMHAAALLAPDDVALNLQALMVSVEYIDHVNSLWDMDIYGVRQPEWSARLEHATQQGRALADRLRQLAPHEPSVIAASAMFDVVAATRMGDAKTQLAAARNAIQNLEAVTAKDPQVLEGNGLFLLGRLYYDLPEFSGGDVDKALRVLPQALAIAPRNPSVVRYYAYVLGQEGRVAEARATLERLLSIEPTVADRQLVADELRLGRDLASKMQDSDLQRRLDAKRSALLKAHPELLTRASSAANQHGGVDPITGATY